MTAAQPKRSYFSCGHDCSRRPLLSDAYLLRGENCLTLQHLPKVAAADPVVWSLAVKHLVTSSSQSGVLLLTLPLISATSVQRLTASGPAAAVAQHLSAASLLPLLLSAATLRLCTPCRIQASVLRDALYSRPCEAGFASAHVVLSTTQNAQVWARGDEAAYLRYSCRVGMWLPLMPPRWKPCSCAAVIWWILAVLMLSPTAQSQCNGCLLLLLPYKEDISQEPE